MSVKINYKGSEILSLSTDIAKKLTTRAKYCEDDFEIINTQDGGGSLPSVTSKIDGGSFILASDESVQSHRIAHDLCENPKGFAIWTEELTEAEADDLIHLIYASFYNYNFAKTSTASNLGCGLYLRRNKDGSAAAASGLPVNATQFGYWINSNSIGVDAGSTYYKAGVTYKWLAWA